MTSNDHYETLGVARDATPDQIKQAVRKKRSAAHTDRVGGDHDTIAAINRAAEVLQDPERRARYDATGDDEASRLQDDAISLLASKFGDALGAPGNLVESVREALIELRQGGRESRKELKQRSAKLTARRGKIRVKTGVNLVHTLIDAQLAAIAAGIAKVDRLLPIVDEALRLLDAYESDEDMPFVRHDLKVLMSQESRPYRRSF